MESLPTVSIVIPTYNCASLLARTLRSLDDQDYPRALQERIVVDGGSTDATREVAQAHGFHVLRNPARSNLYGLPLAFAAATAELILHLDDDNVLDRPDWLRRMVAPFVDPRIVAAEPLFYAAPATENLITRYVALLGADDPLLVYAGFHERFSRVTNTWTGVPREEEDRGDYLAVTFTDTTRVPSLACNAFLARRGPLLEAVRTPWLHIDGAVRMLRLPGRKWAKVRVGVINRHAPGLIVFLAKKGRRLRTRSTEAMKFEYRYAVTRRHLLRIVLRSVAVLPLLWDTVRGMRRQPDAAWFLHPLIVLGTVAVYGATYLRLRAGGAATPAPLRLLERSWRAT